MPAHQKIIRDQQAAHPDPDEHLKRAAASTFDNAEVREITREEAESVILKYEWLGNMGSAKYLVGLFFGIYLAGVVCFGSTAGNNVNKSVCGAEYANQAITLVRGACVHWCHKHGASFLINRACDLMATKGYNIFIAYSDVDAGEIGTVYQAANWTYVGKGGTPTIWVRKDREIDSIVIKNMTRDRRNLKEMKRILLSGGTEYAGKRIMGGVSEPYIQKMTRDEAKAQLIAEGATVKKGTAKHRYIHFAGDKRTIRELRKALKLNVLPYPKRDAEQHANVLLAPPTDTWSDSTVPLQTFRKAPMALPRIRVPKAIANPTFDLNTFTPVERPTVNQKAGKSADTKATGSTGVGVPAPDWGHYGAE